MPRLYLPAMNTITALVAAVLALTPPASLTRPSCQIFTGSVNDPSYCGEKFVCGLSHWHDTSNALGVNNSGAQVYLWDTLGGCPDDWSIRSRDLVFNGFSSGSVVADQATVRVHCRLMYGGDPNAYVDVGVVVGATTYTIYPAAYLSADSTWAWVEYPVPFAVPDMTKMITFLWASSSGQTSSQIQVDAIDWVY